MTRQRTPAEMGKWRRNKGAEAERALVRYLVAWWTDADRSVRTGYRTTTRTSADPGDLCGTPGIIWSVKDWATDEHRKWLDELDRMHGQPGDIRLLVQKRAGYADPGRWWCWMRLDTLHGLLSSITGLGDEQAPVRMELQHVVPLLSKSTQEAA